MQCQKNRLVQLDYLAWQPHYARLHFPWLRSALIEFNSEESTSLAVGSFLSICPVLERLVCLLSFKTYQAVLAHTAVTLPAGWSIHRRQAELHSIEYHIMRTPATTRAVQCSAVQKYVFPLHICLCLISFNYLDNDNDP